MVGHFGLFVVRLNQALERCQRESSREHRKWRARDLQARSICAQIEMLEQRALLAVSNILSPDQAYPTFELAHPFSSSVPSGYSPSQLRAAYGFNQVSLPNGPNGTGQTIAIVAAYHSPTIWNDLQAFDRAFNLIDPPSLTVMSQTGSTTVFPPTDPNSNRALDWEVEAALDVEWSHAFAPGAKIVLVEANSPNFSDLLTAVRTAANLPGVSVVSMSWGSSEFASELSFDASFTTPAGHAGVTFVAASGDSGISGSYPAFSPNVLAAGGTTLSLDSSGNLSEIGWSGSGGGVSVFEPKPSYQNGVVTQSTTKRSLPDVAFDGDPNTGVPVYASFSNGTANPWSQIGGTSLSCPSWAAIVSIVDQARSQNGLGSLDGPTQMLPMLYQLKVSNPSAFHDITLGNNGSPAGPGYDLVTGLGSPVVNVLVSGLSGATSSASKLVILQSPTAGTAGVVLGALNVAITNQSGHIMTSDRSTVTVAISSGPGGFATGSTISVAAVNGIASFNNLVLNTTGSYVLTVSDVGLTSATSNSVTIRAATSKLVILQSPTAGTAGVVLGALNVAITNQSGYIRTSDNSTVTVAIASGPGGFATGSTISVAAVNGIASFNNLVLNTTGSYVLTVSGVGLASATWNSITIRAAAAAKIVFQQQPTAVAVGQVLNPPVTLLVEDQFGNVVTGNTSVVTIGVFSGLGGITSGSTVSVAAVNGIATFNNLALDTAGSYILSASDTGLVGAKSDSFTIGALLPPPQNVTIVALTPTTAQITWQAALGAEGYRIYQLNGSQSVLLGTVSSSTLSVQIDSLTPGSTVSFKVQAFKATAIADSLPVSITMPTVVALDTPILTITVLTVSSVRLNWNAVSGAQGFRIYTITGGVRTLLDTVGLGVTTRSISGLLSFATYQFQIEAYQGTSVSTSAWVSVNTLGL